MITLKSKTDWKQWLGEHDGETIELMGNFIESQSFEIDMDNEELVNTIFNWKRDHASHDTLTIEIDGVDYSVTYDEFSKEFTLE